MSTLNDLICDIDLLINASQAVYRITSKNTIDDDIYAVPDYDRDRFLYTCKIMRAKQYDIYTTISPDKFKGKRYVCALALKPRDELLPIIVAYRGTMTKQDMGSNLNIILRGIAGKNLCDEAYQFYKNIKRNFPTREIILTGHSLGGHLAQYVGTRAYGNQDENIIVRTFNSAPIGRKYVSILGENKLNILNNFAHYRFFDDWLTGVSFSSCYGDLYTFKCNTPDKRHHGFNVMRKLYDNHILSTFHAVLNPEIKALQVGSSSLMKAQKAGFIERTHGIRYSYVYRVQGEWSDKKS